MSQNADTHQNAYHLVRPTCGVCSSMDHLEDRSGCILEEGHQGPHEFIGRDGRHWVWETDLACNCQHCEDVAAGLVDGDYCEIYHERKA